jgi:hypothetical protein
MIIPMPGKIQYQRSDTVITITLDTIRFQGTLKNGLFAQSPRCSKKFYPRNISHLKFPEKSSSRKPHKQSGNDIFPWFGWR